MTGCEMMIASVYLANEGWYQLRSEIDILNIF